MCPVVFTLPGANMFEGSLSLRFLRFFEGSWTAGLSPGPRTDTDTRKYPYMPSLSSVVSCRMTHLRYISWSLLSSYTKERSTENMPIIASLERVLWS